MPYWEERGGRGFSAGLGGEEKEPFPFFPLGSIDHSISVSPTCHLPCSILSVPRVRVSGMIGANVPWKGRDFNEKNTNLWKRIPLIPHRPPSPSLSHHLHHRAIHRQCPWPRTPLCLCVCVCGKRLLAALASIHDHGHWADLHRPSGPRRHDLGGGGGGDLPWALNERLLRLLAPLAQVGVPISARDGL